MNKIGVSGHFDIVKKDKDGNVIDEYHFDNLILNNGLDFVGQMPSRGFIFVDYCLVGSGNSEPNIEQRQLDNQLGYAYYSNYSTNRILTDDETSNSHIMRYRFDENTANGNISEIGVGNYVGSEFALFCRTLIKDPSGRPTAITKLQGEILEITYTLKIVVDMKDSTGVVQIGDKQYRYTARLARNNLSMVNDGYVYDNNIGNIDNEPTGNYDYLSRQFAEYQNGTYKIDVKILAGIDNANFETGVRSLQFRGIFDFWYQVQFDAVDDGTAIPKNNTQKLNIVFEQSWGRKNDT